MALTDELWAAIEPIYARILEHPFLRGLADGTLDEDAFRFYVVQDALYLRDFARALALAAARATAEQDVLVLSRHAAGAIEVERALHAEFLAGWGLDERQVAATPQAPTCLAYTSYLLAVGHGASYEEAVGALLPCYWIYREVGRELAARGSPHPLYRRWIGTYGGEEYDAVVEEALALANRLGVDLGETRRAAVRERFVTTARYEWMFWEMGLRREAWPV